MEYVNINETYNEQDLPRYLTTDEIDQILSNLPAIRSSDKDNALIIKNNIINNLTAVLLNYKVVPSSINQIIDALKVVLCLVQQ
jgi:hypothetical protein